MTPLELWSHGHKSRTVSVYSPNGYGAGCWIVTLGHEHGVTVAHEANFWTWPEEKGGEPACRAACEERGCVFAECPEDVDWAGMDATIAAALAAFERGVWGPRQESHDLPPANPIHRYLDAEYRGGFRAGVEAAAKVCNDRATTREAAAEEMHEAREYKDATTYRTYAAAERALAGTIRKLTPETPA